MSATRVYQPYSEWWAERVEGRAFRRKNGTVVHDADRYVVDDSLRRHYNFDTVTVRLVSRTNGRAQWVTSSQLSCEWEEVRGV
jgi:hypothetical protein